MLRSSSWLGKSLQNMCFTTDCWYVPFITFMAYHRTFRESNMTSGTSGVGLCVVHFVHLHAFTILFSLSGVRFGIRVKPMFSSYLFRLFCRSFMFYLRYLYSLTYTDVPHDSHIRWCSVDLIVIRRVPLEEDEFLDHPDSVKVFVWFMLLNRLFSE